MSLQDGRKSSVFDDDLLNPAETITQIGGPGYAPDAATILEPEVEPQPVLGSHSESSLSYYQNELAAIRIRPAGRPVYCRPSGKFSLIGLIHLAWILPLCVALCFAYVYLEHWIPFIHVNLVLTLGFGAGLGLAARAWVAKGKVRNPPLATLGVVALSVFGWYCSWIVWFWVRSEQAWLVFYPQSMLKLWQLLAVDGIWSIRDLTPKGYALYAIWAGEAALIVLLACKIALVRVRELPFCEDSGRWAELEAGKENLPPIIDVAGFQRALEKGDFTPLLRLTERPLSSEAGTEIKFFKDPGVADFRVIRFEHITRTTNKKGETSVTRRAVLPDLYVTHELYEFVKNLKRIKHESMFQPGGPN